ncbi:phytanoyl-CoA dioxygenase family protein [Allokutzneria sp. A3M-2-11 16]|uniref:phytanoyl-CoA dioxygenase family protein n=1 Tax=Allokutzneria sp. A3M-2-11 16 TaxID=2962043 RepID=UPI0020B68F41|nr:phytanoyl-CoA dioxygenase family protein [Allokutzneria sp. A3M-2-11 16]MCP3803260.1 phytanoyl-CoA dioxygenase family protein [Allokutzneria sp. A3M-2-11 16]
MPLVTPEQPLRDLTDDEVAAYRRDGAIRVSGVFSQDWVERLSDAVDHVLANPSLLTQATADFSAGRGTGDAFMWKTHSTFHEFVFRSPAARIAQQLFGSTTVTAFYDQIFAKPAGTKGASPFHEDASSFPIRGEQVCAMWIALDPCGPDSSALRVVRGSHLWDRADAPVSSSLMQRIRTDERAAPAAERPRQDVLDWNDEQVLGWDLEPGDAVVFHPGALHGATGTGPDRGRRAFVSRWLGDGVTFKPDDAVLPILWDPGLTPGEPMGGSLFPKVLPEPDEAATRWEPQTPEPERLNQFLRKIGKA